MRLHRIVATLLVTILCTQTGCSFLLVEGPPKPDEIPFRRMDDAFCTERNGRAGGRQRRCRVRFTRQSHLC
jgi:hypothetical protein